MNSPRTKYLLLALIDGFFAAVFFSERAALLLPFFIAPFVFILFLAFFQNPQLFMRQWNSLLFRILKFLFLFVGLYIFLKIGQFPQLNDFLVKSELSPLQGAVGVMEGLLFVFLAAISEMCFIIGVIFNALAFVFPRKFGEDVADYKVSFFVALVPTTIFTLIFILGLPFIGSLMS